LLDSGATCEPISNDVPGFSVRAAYAVLAAIGRCDNNGWRRVGRKIGFTNRTL
jgi:2-keto-4-pentenoate hydratase